MSKNRYYYYDHEASAFVEVRPRGRKLLRGGLFGLVLAAVLTGVASWGIDGIT